MKRERQLKSRSVGYGMDVRRWVCIAQACTALKEEDGCLFTFGKEGRKITNIEFEIAL